MASQEKDAYLEYIRVKIERYESQLRGTIYHLNRHKEVYRRLKEYPQALTLQDAQMDIFGT